MRPGAALKVRMPRPLGKPAWRCLLAGMVVGLFWGPAPLWQGYGGIRKDEQDQGADHAARPHIVITITKVLSFSDNELASLLTMAPRGDGRDEEGDDDPDRDQGQEDVQFCWLPSWDIREDEVNGPSDEKFNKDQDAD